MIPGTYCIFIYFYVAKFESTMGDLSSNGNAPDTVFRLIVPFK